MKYIMKILGVILLLICFSCKQEAQSVSHNGNYQVEFLFEKDGCKVYRFYDGRYVYYSDCRGKIESTYTTGGKHKTTHYDETLNN